MFDDAAIKVASGQVDVQVTTPETITITFPVTQDWQVPPGHDEQLLSVQILQIPLAW